MAHSQSLNEAGSFNPRLFFCSASRLSSEGIRRDEDFLSHLGMYGAVYSMVLLKRSSKSHVDDWFYLY